MQSFGCFQIATVDAGRFRLDGGAMFGVVPKALWSRALPTDGHNRVQLALRLLLIVDSSSERRRCILVDTGIGDKFDAKRVGQLGIEPPDGGLPAAVARAGIDPAGISDVIITHLHFDHAGGATQLGGDGRLRPTFPDATYHVQRRALKWAQHATERDAASFRESDFQVLAQRGHLHLLDGPQELFPGVSLLISEGHTVGQQIVLVDGGGDGKLQIGRAHV